MSGTLKCPGCGTAHVLDKKLLTKGAPNDKNELHSGYRVECLKCLNPYMVTVLITGVGTAKEVGRVSTGPMPAEAVSVFERDAIADTARAASLGEDGAGILAGQEAVTALKDLGVSKAVALRTGGMVARAKAEGDVQDALAPLYEKQEKARVAKALEDRAAGDKALAGL